MQDKDKIITQVIGISPDGLRESIVKDLRSEFKKLAKNSAPKETEEYFTRKETAKLFKVSVVTISKWCEIGILKPYRLGKFIRFKRTELEESLIRIHSKDH